MPTRKKPKRKAGKTQAVKDNGQGGNDHNERKDTDLDGALPVEKRANISPEARRFILKSIAEYNSYDWITAELKRKYGFARSPDSLKSYYGANPDYKPQIQKYRDRFNNGIADEPLASRRHLLQVLYETLSEARAAKDYKGAASITKQIREMLGYTTPAEVEINHHHIGGLSVDQRLKALFDNRQAPPQLPGSDMPLLPDSQIVDIEPEDGEETDGG
jgi:hypothetical protein